MEKKQKSIFDHSSTFKKRKQVTHIVHLKALLLNKRHLVFHLMLGVQNRLTLEIGNTVAQLDCSLEQYDKIVIS